MLLPLQLPMCQKFLKDKMGNHQISKILDSSLLLPKILLLYCQSPAIAVDVSISLAIVHNKIDTIIITSKSFLISPFFFYKLLVIEEVLVICFWSFSAFSAFSAFLISSSSLNRYFFCISYLYFSSSSR